MSGLVPENVAVDGVPVGVATATPIVAADGSVSTLLTPTQQIVLDANATAVGTDARGRKIGAKRVSMSVRRRVIKALTAEAASKPQYVGMAVLAMSCDSIDGEATGLLDSEIKIDALIDRLDDEGLAALSILQGQFAAGRADPKN